MGNGGSAVPVTYISAYIASAVPADFGWNFHVIEKPIEFDKPLESLPQNSQGKIFVTAKHFNQKSTVHSQCGKVVWSRATTTSGNEALASNPTYGNWNTREKLLPCYHVNQKEAQLQFFSDATGFAWTSGLYSLDGEEGRDVLKLTSFQTGFTFTTSMRLRKGPWTIDWKHELMFHFDEVRGRLLSMPFVVEAAGYDVDSRARECPLDYPSVNQPPFALGNTGNQVLFSPNEDFHHGRSFKWFYFPNYDQNGTVENGKAAKSKPRQHYYTDVGFLSFNNPWSSARSLEFIQLDEKAPGFIYWLSQRQQNRTFVRQSINYFRHMPGRNVETFQSELAESEEPLAKLVVLVANKASDCTSKCMAGVCLSFMGQKRVSCVVPPVSTARPKPWTPSGHIDGLIHGSVFSFDWIVFAVTVTVVALAVATVAVVGISFCIWARRRVTDADVGFSNTVSIKVVTDEEETGF